MFLRKRLTLRKNQIEEEKQEARILMNDDPEQTKDNAFIVPLEN